MSEILAPAGSPEMLFAAVRAGADAVYFGIGEFNARRNAQNFTHENIKEYAQYCKARSVKMYLTLNTLVSDKELPSVLKTVQTACECGIDAVLLQDMGLVSIIKKCAPDLPIHASTQMAVHNVEALDELKRLGFSRAVLARENSADEIRQICARASELGIEIEVFVQGALCMCVSGQCLMSAALGGRSGNRGLCAGTCRLPFSVVGSNDEYALSLKDLSLLENFKNLSEMGVCSFKIEGRMKRPEYAACAVAAAVSARDNAPDFLEKLDLLKTVFSRSGFTKGYYDGKLSSDMFGVRLESDIDSSKKIHSQIHSFYRTAPSRVPLDMVFAADGKSANSLSVTDGQNSESVFGIVAEIAKKTPTDKQTIADKLSKLGGTGYYQNSVEVDICDNLAIANSEISKLKSQAIEQIERERRHITPWEYQDIDFAPPKKRANRSFKTVLNLHSLTQLPDHLGGVDAVILPLNTECEKVADLMNIGIDVWIKTPPVLFGDNRNVLQKLTQFKSLGVTKAVAENIGGVNIIKKAELEVVGGATLNCFNSFACDGYGINSFIISREMHLSMLTTLDTDAFVGVEVYGRTPMMTVRCCPMTVRVGCKNCSGFITDRKGAKLPIFCEDNVTRIYNSVPTYLCDKVDVKSLADFCVLSFTTESKERVEKILTLYKNNQPFDCEYTRGMMQSKVK